MSRSRFVGFCSIAALCGLGLSAGACGVALASGQVLSNGRISVDFDDPSTGFFTGDSDRVDSISWINSNGDSTGNLAANSLNNLTCNDPDEFFGESEGEPDEAQAPLMISPGVVSNWSGSTGKKGSTNTTGRDCNGNALSGKTRTSYALSSNRNKINMLAVTRIFLFNSRTQDFTNTGLRAYMARLPISPYNTVLIPDSSGAIATYDANNCGYPCEITDWNGRWLADDDGNGNGMMIIRASIDTAPAIVVIDSDGYSNSNVSSVVLEQPTGGWKSAVREEEFLCFYDSTSWTAQDRSNGTLPQGCAAP